MLGTESPASSVSTSHDVCSATQAESAVDLPVLPLPTTEAAMVRIIVDGLAGLFGEPTVICEEVRSHGRSRADVCALIDGSLVALEAKRTDWQRALGQAALNKHVVDRSYIALWSGRIPPAATAAAMEYGVGVVAVHPGGLSVVVPAQPTSPDAHVRARIIDQMSTGVS